MEGPAGIGKSRLLEVGRAAAARSGLEVLRARGGELERDFSYGVVRQLVERRLAEASPAERSRWLSGAAEFAKLAVSPPRQDGETEPADVSFAVMHGLYWLVANLAAERPVMLQIDDAHWADASTLRFLLYLRARLDGLALLVLIAARPGEPGVDATLLAQITSESCARRSSRPVERRGGRVAPRTGDEHSGGAGVCICVSLGELRKPVRCSCTDLGPRSRWRRPDRRQRRTCAPAWSRDRFALAVAAACASARSGELARASGCRAGRRCRSCPRRRPRGHQPPSGR